MNILRRKAKLVDIDGNGKPDVAILEEKKNGNGQAWLKWVLGILLLPGLGAFGRMFVLADNVDTLKTQTKELQKQAADTTTKQAAMEAVFQAIAKSLDEIKQNQDKLRDKMDENQKELRRELQKKKDK